jgi:hypothetical protein
MPPSGFNSKAIESASIFVRECFVDLQQEVADGKHPDFKTALEFEIGQLNKALKSQDSIKDQGTKGALQFIQGCYVDLQEKVANFSIEDLQVAIDSYLSELENTLRKLHINAEGKVVERVSS